MLAPLILSGTTGEQIARMLYPLYALVFKPVCRHHSPLQLGLWACGPIADLRNSQQGRTNDHDGFVALLDWKDSTEVEVGG